MAQPRRPDDRAADGQAVPHDPTGTPHTDRDPRTGRFVRGNGAAVTTGLRATQTTTEARHLVLDAEVAAFLDGSLADDGGRDQIPTRRLSQHQYRALVHRHILQVSAALDTCGVFDRHGKLRLAWLSKLESLIREGRALDQSLGLARRSKVISLDAYVRDTYTTPTREAHALTEDHDHADHATPDDDLAPDRR